MFLPFAGGAAVVAAAAAAAVAVVVVVGSVFAPTSSSGSLETILSAFVPSLRSLIARNRCTLFSFFTQSTKYLLFSLVASGFLFGARIHCC